MSFILDAIKKSENERQRSKQSDLHSLQDSAPQVQPENTTMSRLLLLVVAIVIIMVAAWWLWLQVAPQLSPRLVEWLQGSQVVSTETQTEDKAANTHLASAPMSSSSSDTNSATTGQYSSQDEVPPNNQIKELWQLPADYQSTIPELDFSFHVFSEDSSERMIIINGRRMREGQMVSRGLTLRVITETGVILYSGGRFFHVDVIEKW